MSTLELKITRIGEVSDEVERWELEGTITVDVLTYYVHYEYERSEYGGGSLILTLMGTEVNGPLRDYVDDLCDEVLGEVWEAARKAQNEAIAEIVSKPRSFEYEEEA